ncbi:unnamed protein product [Phytomonas sp. EM1]|nr:unnamed protein product [Phytomonas sp. EM1]|eukprot:CCW63680.1 unnamed protein product [Phytomonas sp. isolate EM1]
MGNDGDANISPSTKAATYRYVKKSKFMYFTAKAMPRLSKQYTSNPKKSSSTPHFDQTLCISVALPEGNGAIGVALEKYRSYYCVQRCYEIHHLCVELYVFFKRIEIRRRK